jgi:hypothetical protein
MASHEEKLHEVSFAAGYRSYKKRRGKWLPKIGREGLRKQRDVYQLTWDDPATRPAA